MWSCVQMCMHDDGCYLFTGTVLCLYMWVCSGVQMGMGLNVQTHVYTCITRISLSVCIYMYAKASVRSCMQPCAHEVDMVCIHVCNDISVYKCVYQCSDNLAIHVCLGEYACVCSLNSQGPGPPRGPACTCLCARACVHKGPST